MNRSLLNCSPAELIAMATGEVGGIPLIDHIVVGIDKAISIQEWRSGNRW